METSVSFSWSSSTCATRLGVASSSSVAGRICVRGDSHPSGRCLQTRETSTAPPRESCLVQSITFYRVPSAHTNSVKKKTSGTGEKNAECVRTGRSTPLWHKSPRMKRCWSSWGWPEIQGGCYPEQARREHLLKSTHLLVADDLRCSLWRGTYGTRGGEGVARLLFWALGLITRRGVGVV